MTVWNQDDARYCTRCLVELHGTAQDQPHLCADVALRHARREKQVDATLVIMRRYGLVSSLVPQDGDVMREAAEAVVARLANMGVDQD